MSSVKFTSEQGQYLDLPLQGDWKSLGIFSTITVAYVESKEERLRLVIPEHAAGTVHLRVNERGGLDISVDTRGSQCPSSALRLEIAHKGLKRVALFKEAHFSVTGSSVVNDICAMDNSVVDCSQAKIRTSHMIVHVHENVRCEIGTLRCKTLKIDLTKDCKLTMKDIRCSDTVHLRSYDNSIAFLSGETVRFESEQYDESRIYASALNAETARVAVCDLSTLSCKAAVLDFYASLYAFIRNEHPKPQEHPIPDYSIIRQVRQVSVEDACQLFIHLKPEEEGEERPLFLHDEVHSKSSFISRTFEFHRNSDDLFNYKDGGKVGSMSQEEVCDYIHYKALRKEVMVVSVSEDDIDWESIPDVKERFLRSALMPYECLTRRC